MAVVAAAAGGEKSEPVAGAFALTLADGVAWADVVVLALSRLADGGRGVRMTTCE